MAFPVPAYTRSEVNRAGQLLAAPSPDTNAAEIEKAIDALVNWRSCHGYPVNTFQATLRHRMARIDPQGFVAQRLKRLPSILNKLKRFDKMQLCRMQDIGGLRVVVGSLGQVESLRKTYTECRHRSFLHELASERNYITNPKDSGYRSVHLVYRYKNMNAPAYNGLLLELQLRTRLQHIWATAVETIGTFLSQALKASEGSDEWLRFFSLAGSAFAHLERSAPVPGYEQLGMRETFQRTTHAAHDLRVHDRLDAYTAAAEVIESKGVGATYHLIVLDPVEKHVRVIPFSRDRLFEANREYAIIEKRISDGEELQAVLVSAGPLAQLKRAYPNYFLDTHEFLVTLRRIAKRAGP